VVRASDDTREHTVAVLRKGLLRGRLGTDTFVERVDAAYGAKTRDQLASLTHDLPRPRALWRSIYERLRVAADERTPGRVIALRPPELDCGDRRVLGRDPACDFAIADPSVSARHAELLRTGDGWLIRDLESRNGTRVNGWLVTEQDLHPGDTLSLGATVFVFRP
jgi:hypothetical protein